MLLDDSYFDIPDLYYSNYHSEMKSKDQKEIINNLDPKISIIDLSGDFRLNSKAKYQKF